MYGLAWEELEGWGRTSGCERITYLGAFSGNSKRGDQVQHHHNTTTNRRTFRNLLQRPFQLLIHDNRQALLINLHDQRGIALESLEPELADRVFRRGRKVDRVCGL